MQLTKLEVKRRNLDAENLQVCVRAGACGLTTDLCSLWSKTGQHWQPAASPICLYVFLISKCGETKVTGTEALHK